MTGHAAAPLCASAEPCTRQDDHDGDCENWYAGTTWPRPQEGADHA